MIFSSCSVLSRKESRFKPLSLKKSFASICLNSSGKGKIEFLSRKNVFRFSSSFNKSKWELGVAIPMSGEEILSMEYQPPVRVSGEFYQRILMGIEEGGASKAQRDLLRRQLHSMALFMQLKTTTFESCNTKEKICTIRGAKFKYKIAGGRFEIELANRRENLFKIVADSYNGSFFERIVFSLERRNKFGSERKKLGLKLLVQNCQK